MKSRSISLEEVEHTKSNLICSFLKATCPESVVIKLIVVSAVSIMNGICFVSALYLINIMIDDNPAMSKYPVIFRSLVMLVFVFGFFLTGWYIYREIYVENLNKNHRYYQCIWQSIAFTMTSFFYPLAFTALLYVVLFYAEMFLNVTYTMLVYSFTKMHPVILGCSLLVIIAIFRYYFGAKLLNWIGHHVSMNTKDVKFITYSAWTRLKNLYFCLCKSCFRLNSHNKEENVFLEEV